ncbi:ribosome biogenesis factor YjgA [Thioalkalivibrio nitratireducens]|nr:ribosome biogenesis factor YjgA [Thioalkalivibrio nitratireducens]
MENSDPDARRSKTQLKRESLGLQKLGAELVKLSPERLRRIDLPESLRAAVLDAQHITSRGALRRQLQYIGRLMRGVDPAPIDAQLAALRGESERARADFHALERWRERLLADDAALTEWLESHPAADAQHLRQLIRNARRGAAEGRPPRASRALFRFLAASRPGGAQALAEPDPDKEQRGR